MVEDDMSSLPFWVANSPDSDVCLPVGVVFVTVGRQAVCDGFSAFILTGCLVKVLDRWNYTHHFTSLLTLHASLNSTPRPVRFKQKETREACGALLRVCRLTRARALCACELSRAERQERGGASECGESCALFNCCCALVTRGLGVERGCCRVWLR